MYLWGFVGSNILKFPLKSYHVLVCSYIWSVPHQAFTQLWYITISLCQSASATSVHPSFYTFTDEPSMAGAPVCNCFTQAVVGWWVEGWQAPRSYIVVTLLFCTCCRWRCKENAGDGGGGGGPEEVVHRVAGLPHHQFNIHPFVNTSRCK